MWLVAAVLAQIRNISIIRESSPGQQTFRKITVSSVWGETGQDQEQRSQTVLVAVALERRVQIREVESTRLTDQLVVGGEDKSGIRETS